MPAKIVRVVTGKFLTYRPVIYTRRSFCPVTRPDISMTFNLKKWCLYRLSYRSHIIDGKTLLGIAHNLKMLFNKPCSNSSTYLSSLNFAIESNYFYYQNHERSRNPSRGSYQVTCCAREILSGLVPMGKAERMLPSRCLSNKHRYHLVGIITSFSLALLFMYK